MTQHTKEIAKLIRKDPIDERGAILTEDRSEIHRDAPSYAEQSQSQDILETGIKVNVSLYPWVL